MNSLIDTKGPAGTTLMGLPHKVTVADAVGNNRWRTQCARSRKFPALREKILAFTEQSDAESRDKVLWHHSVNEYCNTFSAFKTWEQIRRRKPRSSGM